MATNNIKTEWRVKSRGMWVGVCDIDEDNGNIKAVVLFAKEERAQSFEDFDDANNLAELIGADIFVTTITTETKPIRWPEKGATDAEHPDT